jgi:transposase-like protein
VLDGLRGEDSIAELCRRAGISQGIYYKGSKDFMEAGKRRLAGDTARAATTDEVKDLRREARDLKEIVAEQTLELRLLKKSMTGPSRQIALQSPESLNNFTPSDVYFGRDKAILRQRERIKRKTLEARRLHHSQRAA